MRRAIRGSLLISLVVLAACGGGGTPDEGATTTALPKTTTTTAVTPESYGAAICEAEEAIEFEGVVESYSATAAAYAEVTPTDDKKAALDAYVDVNRQLAALWSDPNPITPMAFSEAFTALIDELLPAVEAIQVEVDAECELKPGETTTTTTAITAGRRVIEVARGLDGEGLYWFSVFGCPEGTTHRFEGEIQPHEDDPTIGSVFDPEAGKADPFTGVLAAESFDRVNDKIKATCV